MSERTYATGNDMRCPRCGSPMEAQDERHYETLAEHVFAPNRQPSLKTGYGCTDPECEARDCRWLEDGEGPYGPWEPEWGTGEAWYPAGTFAQAVAHQAAIRARNILATTGDPDA